MTRAVRLSATLLLAGLVLVSLPGVAWAENKPWKFEKGTLPDTHRSLGGVISWQQYGGFIAFGCVRAEPSSNFVAMVSVVEDNMYPWGDYTVAWTIDNRPATNSTWQPNPNFRNRGLFLAGQEAYELARATMQAEKQIEVKTPRGIIIKDLDYAAKTIGRLLKHCRLQ